MTAARHPRAVPVLAATAIALAYLVLAPRSSDLAAHLLRAKLFAAEGFAGWDNWWYAGHYTLSYSVLFPAAASALTPQLVAAIASVMAAAAFAQLASDRFGSDAALGSTWFALATGTNLLSGRLTFAAGLAPALLGVLALARGRPWAAIAAALATGLVSPVAALFAAVAGLGYAAGAAGTPDAARRHAIRGVAFAAASVLPVGAVQTAFPSGGTEPFELATLVPILAIAAVAVRTVPTRALQAGTVLYAAVNVLAYAIPSPLGSNAARLGPLVAGPLAALVWWPRRRKALALMVIPLAYVQWQAAIRDVTAAGGDASTTASYYAPLLAFLDAQPGAPFRVEVVATALHWEAYEVAPRYPLARGWERQTDTQDNALFYRGRLTATRYERWLHDNAVAFVALPDAPLDYSARAERAVIGAAPAYLRPAFRSRHWRVYAVTDPAPLVTGAATLSALTAAGLRIHADGPGSALARVRFTPYWQLSHGCVSRHGDFTLLTFRRAVAATLSFTFAPGRIGATGPRCG